MNSNLIGKIVEINKYFNANIPSESAKVKILGLKKKNYKVELIHPIIKNGGDRVPYPKGKIWSLKPSYIIVPEAFEKEKKATKVRLEIMETVYKKKQNDFMKQLLSDSESEEEYNPLECKICQEHDVQLIGKCGHMICEGCHNKLLRKICPTCRAKYGIRSLTKIRW
jgi:hypothetical protein